MSLVCTVPDVVPSDFHSSDPDPSFAANRKLVPSTTPAPGADPVVPERISLTKAVPALVPSVFHNSGPVEAVVADRYAVEPTTATRAGDEDAVPEEMFCT